MKADFHRMGAYFPSEPVDHQIETEGFAQIVKGLGGKIIGLTGVYVYHGEFSFSFSSIQFLCFLGISERVEKSEVLIGSNRSLWIERELEQEELNGNR